MSRTTTPPAAQSKYLRSRGERISVAGRAALDGTSSLDDGVNGGGKEGLDEGLDDGLDEGLDEGFNGGGGGNLEAAEVLGDM